MTTRFSVNPSETVPSFDIRNELAQREIYEQLLSRSQSGEPLEFPVILQTHPQLRQHRSFVLDLVYEDYCQRSAAGDVRQADEYAQTFPEYRSQIAQLLDVHRYFHSTGQVPLWLNDHAIWPQPDQEFLGYRICSELGRGAIGRVYLAQELELSERFVALKLSPYGHEEAKLLAKLSHPHVVPINSIKDDPESGLSAVCMPYQGRTTLADLPQQGPQPSALSNSSAFWEEFTKRGTGIKNQTIEIPASVRKRPYVDTVLELLVQIVRALVYVHERRILHRDLKPSNILITPDRTAMLLDFNLSTDLADVQNRIGGTLPYMSPEQIEQVLISPGEPSTLDERTDLYSVGVIGYELLRGRLPFAAADLGIANKREAKDYVGKIQAGASSLRASQPQLDHRTAQVIAQCLEADREKRPASAKVLLAQLESCRTPLARLRRVMLRHPRQSSAIATGIAAVILAVTLFLALRAPLHVRETELAWQALAASDQSGAKEHFQRALIADPQYIDALNGMGRVDFLAGIYNPEDNPWRKSYGLQPDPRIAACLGYQDCVHNKMASGQTWLEKALPGLSNSANLLCNLATTKRLRGSGWQAEAIALYSRALEIEPRLQPALVGRAQAAYFLDVNSKRPIRPQTVDDLELAITATNPSPELLATAAKYHLAAFPGSKEHFQRAKHLVLQSLEKGFSYSDLKNRLLREKLLEDPDIQKYEGKISDLPKGSKYSIWDDPWPKLFNQR